MKDKDSVPPKHCLWVFFPKLSKTRFGTVFHLSVICLFYRREIDLAVGFLHHLHCNLFPLLKNPNLTRFLWEAFLRHGWSQSNSISVKNQMRGRICSTHFPKMSMTSILMINNKTKIFRICFDFVSHLLFACHSYSDLFVLFTNESLLKSFCSKPEF